MFLRSKNNSALMTSRIGPLLNRYGKFFKNDFSDQGSRVHTFFLREIEHKRVALPEFRRIIVFSWHQYKKKQSKEANSPPF